MALDDVTRFIDASLEVAIRHREEELGRLREELDRLRASRRALAGGAAPRSGTTASTGEKRPRQPTSAIKAKRAEILNLLAEAGPLDTPEVARRLGFRTKAALPHLQALKSQNLVVELPSVGRNHAKIWKVRPGAEEPSARLASDDLAAALLPPRAGNSDTPEREPEERHGISVE